MATLYVNFAEDCESPIADAHEKLAITGSDAVTTASSPAAHGAGTNRSEIELLSDVACLVSIGATPTTADDGAFYLIPAVRKVVKAVPPGYKVAAKTA